MRQILHRCRVAAGGLLMLAALAFGPVAGTAPAAAQAMDPAAQVIQHYYSALLPAVEKVKSGSARERAQRIRQAILNAFDLRVMVRTAVGPGWSRIAPSQQNQLIGAYTNFVVATYASQLQDYNGQGFKVDPTSDVRGRDAIVKTQIGNDTVNYLVRNRRIIDIYFNGTVSDMANRRAEFESLLQSGGVESLIANLRSRTDKLLAS